MFAPGDEVVCVDDSPSQNLGLRILVRAAVYTVSNVDRHGHVWLASTAHPLGKPWLRDRFRKVERRNDSLSIEAFLTIKPGFEEPKRAPAKKRERVQ